MPAVQVASSEGRDRSKGSDDAGVLQRALGPLGRGCCHTSRSCTERCAAQHCTGGTRSTVDLVAPAGAWSRADSGGMVCFFCQPRARTRPAGRALCLRCCCALQDRKQVLVLVITCFRCKRAVLCNQIPSFEASLLHTPQRCALRANAASWW